MSMQTEATMDFGADGRPVSIQFIGVEIGGQSAYGILASKPMGQGQYLIAIKVPGSFYWGGVARPRNYSQATNRVYLLKPCHRGNRKQFVRYVVEEMLEWDVKATHHGGKDATAVGEVPLLRRLCGQGASDQSK
jgi:hypothetical protein